MNKNLFSTKPTLAPAPPTNAVNHSGVNAYAHSDEHALAQFAMTGMFGDTFYEDAETQLEKVLELARKVDTTFVAQVAAYARQNGFMKDMPAVLAAVLSTRGSEGLVLLRKIFPVVIDNGKMLSTFVQVMRSGRVGRKSLGTSVKTTIQLWFDTRSDFQLFRDSVGMTPSMADIIKMVHPRPSNPTRQALYGYLIGKELNDEVKETLPDIVKEFEAFKTQRLSEAKPGFKAGLRHVLFGSKPVKVPNVPFQMLTSLNLTSEDWKAIARNGNWHFTRMNLNTFARHGVFQDPEMVQIVADKLRDRESILKNKVMPFQLLVTYKNMGAEVPTEILNALHDAVEVAVENVPNFGPGGVAVMVDVSGSMKSGRVGPARPDGTPSSVRCIDVAGLFASAILRKNPNAIVLPFDFDVHVQPGKALTSRDSILTNTEKLASYGGGGTTCSSALTYMNKMGLKAKTVIYLSDNESWVDAKPGYYGRRGSTATMDQWKIFKVANPQAKMINIDMTPNGTAQTSNDADIMNIGGFTDKIFTTVQEFVLGTSESQQWVPAIKAMVL
jgi:60 kDa SS-A/Ro ribonucleoprotein